MQSIFQQNILVVILMLVFMKATNVWIINFFLEHSWYLVSDFTTLMSINKLEKIVNSNLLKHIPIHFLRVPFERLSRWWKPWIISLFSVQCQSISLPILSSENINTTIYEVSNNFRIRQIWFPNCRKWTNCIQNCELYPISGDNKEFRTRWSNCNSPLYDYRPVCKRIFV